MGQAAGERKILVVEDTPASLKLLSELPGNAGYLVRQAPDRAPPGPGALRRRHPPGHRPDAAQPAGMEMDSYPGALRQILTQPACVSTCACH